MFQALNQSLWWPVKHYWCDDQPHKFSWFKCLQFKYKTDQILTNYNLMGHNHCTVCGNAKTGAVQWDSKRWCFQIKWHWTDGSDGLEGSSYRGLSPPHLDSSQSPSHQSLSCTLTVGPQSCSGCLLRLHWYLEQEKRDSIQKSTLFL